MSEYIISGRQPKPGRDEPVPVNVVSGTITATIGEIEVKNDTGSPVPVSATSLPLPTGAATSANQTTIIGHVDGIEGLLTTIDADTGTLAGAVSGSEVQVDVITMPTTTVQATNLDIRDLSSVSDSVTVTGTVAVTQSGTWDEVGINDSGNSITVDNGGTFAVQAAQSGTWILGANSGVDIGDVTINNSTGAAAVNIQDGGNSITVDGTVAVSGTVAVTQSGTWDEIGINDSGNSITVDDGGSSLTVDGTVTATNETVTTATLSNVNDTASSTTLLSSTAGRKGASFYNDSTATAYVKFGTTASTTSFTVLMRPGDFYEIPQPVYTGRIDCIWGSDASGAMRITELT